MYNTSTDENTITEADYTFCEPPLSMDADYYGIRLKTGPWANVIFSFGKVQIVEEGDTASINFDYKIESGPPDLSKDPDFGDYAGKILHHVIEESLKRQIENDSKLPNDGTTEPDNQ